MDGNLLDSDTTDTTLAKDWSLPELPEGNSSLPSASQELAEIFGTSDDEEDDFPFALPTSLSMNKGFTDIGLTSSVAKTSLFNPHDDSELFLNTIPKSLRIENVAQSSPPATILSEAGADVTSSKDSVVVKEPKVGKEEEQCSSELVGDEMKEKDTVDEAMDTSDIIQTESTTTDDGIAKTVKAEQSTESSGDTSESGEKQQSEPKPLRKSARLRGKYPPREEITVSPKNVVKKESTNEENKVDTQPAATQEPDKKVEDEPVAAEPEEKSEPEDTTTLTESSSSQETTKTREEEEEEDNNSGSCDEDSDSEEEDDPERLWCICRQPHDDRFMICCDHCEEWFHGDCVGISVGQGKRMEREGKEYVCPNCVAKEKMEREQKEAGRTARQMRREQMKETDLKKKLGQQHPLAISRRLSSGSGGPNISSSEGDQYGLSQLFLPDNAPKKEESAMEDDSAVKREDTGQCVACGKSTVLPSVYCSTQCIERHANRSLRKLAERGITHRKTASEFVRGLGGVSVIDKATGKMYMGISAPSERDLVPWLQDHPSFQVLMHKNKERKRVKMKQEAKKEPESPSKLPKIALMDPESVRANAKKALQQILWKRCEGAPDMSDMKQSKVEEIADEVEEKLFNLHQDITPKYKTKYRSLLFNLKDTRNPGLFRKVLLGEISPRDLVRMKGEKLASEELAQWREKTIKKDLEMIKVREEEENVLSQVIRKKTYKGDVEIETPDKNDIIETITTVDKEAPSSSSNDGGDGGSGVSSNVTDDSTTKTSAKAGTTKSGSKSKGQSDTKPSGTSSKAGGILNLLKNTTSEHGKHVFDHHCDICTGKIKAPPTSTAPTTTPDNSHPSPDSRTADSELVTNTETESRSPDSGVAAANQVIWRGSISMVGLTKFTTIGYPVSGPVEYLDEVLPDSLQLMGRIAHVQVWDYMDKLRSSSSRDIVVVRFECLDGETDAYMAMFNYFLRRHRCGVISNSYYGIKDMYLVPLPSYRDVAPQLLPFNGPGIPMNHSDMLLGVIVRSKTKRKPHHHHHRPKTKQATHHVSTVTEPHAKLIGFKRHYSASEELVEPPDNTKKSKTQLEVGIDNTPPLSGNEEDEDDSSPYEPAVEWSSYQQPSSMAGHSDLGGVLIHTETESEDSEGAVDGEFKQKGEDESLKSVQMSFYGQHRPLESQALKTATTQSNPDPVSISKSVTASLSATMNIPSSVGIQSILSQMSEDKLKELASVMTTFGHVPNEGDASEDNTQNASTTTTTITATTTELSTINTSAQPHTTTASFDDDSSMDVSSTHSAPVPPAGTGHLQQPLSGGMPAVDPSQSSSQGNLAQQSYLPQQQLGANQQELPLHSQFPVQQQQQQQYNQTQWTQHQNDHRYGDGMTNYPASQGQQLYTNQPPPPPGSQQIQQHPDNQQVNQQQQLPYHASSGPSTYPPQAAAPAAPPMPPPSQDYSTSHHYDGRYDYHQQHHHQQQHHYDRTDHGYYDSRPYDERYFESHDYGHGQKPSRGGRRPPYERFRDRDQGGRPRR